MQKPCGNCNALEERKKGSTTVDCIIMLMLVRTDSISLFSLAKQLVSSEFLMIRSAADSRSCRRRETSVLYCQ